MNGKLIMYFLLLGMFILLQSFDRGVFSNVWSIMIYACLFWIGTEFEFSIRTIKILVTIGNLTLIIAIVELIRVVLGI